MRITSLPYKLRNWKSVACSEPPTDWSHSHFIFLKGEKSGIKSFNGRDLGDFNGVQSPVGPMVTVRVMQITQRIAKTFGKQGIKPASVGIWKLLTWNISYQSKSLSTISHCFLSYSFPSFHHFLCVYSRRYISLKSWTYRKAGPFSTGFFELPKLYLICRKFWRAADVFYSAQCSDPYAE